MSNTGFVLKNDIYARGSHIDKEGMIQTSKKCSVCSQAIEAAEIVYYVFAARGTQSASSRYVHTTCEPQCRITPMDGKKSICRICGSSKGLDGCFELPWRKIYYHQACLPNTRKEIVPEEQLAEKVRKRAEGRLNRGRVWYSVNTNPYTGINLSRADKGLREDNQLIVVLKPLNGNLIDAFIGGSKRVVLFSSGCWRSEGDIRYCCSLMGRTDTDNVLQIYKDLRQLFDGRGRVKGERLDQDYKLRFVLKYGTSIEGAVNDPVK